MNDNQASLFLIYIATGMLICIFYDIFRALRKTIKTSNIVTYIEDIIFWTIVAIFLIIEILNLNSGELRLYTFIGIIIGCIIYLLTVSKFILNILIKIFKTTQKIILLIIKPTINLYKFIISLFAKISTNIKRMFLKRKKNEKIKLK